jgi:hypothetical protein
VSRKKQGGKIPPFTAVIRHTTKTKAWLATSVGAKALFVALQSLHNDKSQNAVFLSARRAVSDYGLGNDKNAIGVWLKELEHYGFLVQIQGPHLGAEGKGKSATYRLTDRYYAGKPPTYDFQNWDGVLFEVPISPSAQKRKTSAVEKARLTKLKKQNPVQSLRTHRPEPTDIRAKGEMPEIGNNCPEPTDIRNDFDCPEPTDIATLPSTRLLKPNRRHPEPRLVVSNKPGPDFDWLATIFPATEEPAKLSEAA